MTSVIFKYYILSRMEHVNIAYIIVKLVQLTDVC